MQVLPKAPSIASASLMAAYKRIGERLRRDPLLDVQEGFDLEMLGARLAHLGEGDVPVERFWGFLHGPEQFRLAGLMLLQEALRSDEIVTVEDTLRVEEAFVLVQGDLVVRGNLIVADGAALVVLGGLVVLGNLIGGTVDYSVVAASRIEMRSGVTVGELLATEAILASDRLYLADNGYSCRSPRIEARVLVDYERSNRIDEVVAKIHVTKWDSDAAARALGFDPEQTNLLRDFRASLLSE